jgi:uncharacterized protein YjiS (DUF1127 family)
MPKLLDPTHSPHSPLGRALRAVAKAIAERMRHAREGTELAGMDVRERRDIGLTDYDAAWLRHSPVRGAVRDDLDALFAQAHAARSAALRDGLRALWGWLRALARRYGPIAQEVPRHGIALCARGIARHGPASRPRQFHPSPPARETREL